jgi:hypothetical protein
MRNHLAFRFDLRTFLAGSAVLFGIGCTQDVTPVGDGTGGEATSGTTGTAQGGNGGAGTSTSTSTGGAGTGGSGAGMASSVSTGGSGSANAIAMLQSEVPEPGAGGGTSGSSGGGGPGPDPNALHIYVGDVPIDCAAPYELDCGNHWTVSFILPPALQQPGTYSLEALNATSFVTLDGSPECGGGGGSFWDGQVQITSIDATGVSGTFIGTSTFDFDANGDFSAVRCFQ